MNSAFAWIERVTGANRAQVCMSIAIAMACIVATSCTELTSTVIQTRMILSSAAKSRAQAIHDRAATRDLLSGKMDRLLTDCQSGR